VQLSDRRTHEAAGKACASALAKAGWSVTELPIADGADGSPPVCDEQTKLRLAAELPQADVLVAVGSGVVNDLSKWLAAEAELPYVVFATAASMNGYTAANVAPSIDGVKSLFRARAPRLVAAQPQVLESAPFELTAAGLGDVIAKPVSTADWIVNHQLFDEPFSQPVAGIIDAVEPRYLDDPEAIGQRTPAAIAALFEALLLSGCAMTLQGSSLPASGGEHLVSHTLDMMSGLDGVPHDLHGRQVGVATILAAALYQRVLGMDRPPWRPDGAPFDAGFWGPSAAAVEREHRLKQQRMEQACELLGTAGRWEAVRRAVAPVLRPPELIKRCLRRAGAAHRIEDLGCSRERFLLAVQHAGAIRGRFTSIDLAHAAGVLPDAAEELVDTWLR